MTDRDAIRRELAAEIVASAEATAARHFAAMEQAREYGKDER